MQIAQAIPATATRRSKVFLPREHGATAMMLTPPVGVAILARTWHWSEIAVVLAAFAAMAAKDPAVLLVRQRFVWKGKSPDAASAARWLAGWGVLLIASVLVLFATWPLKAFLAIGAGVAAFGALAVYVNVKNRQRSTLFQIASAAALTSTSLATSIAALGTVPRWCWWFWILVAAQASAGILVVHARLDARIALRKAAAPSLQFRRASQAAIAVLFCAAAAAVFLGQGYIAAALALAVAAYGWDLRRQTSPASLQTPLKTVGQQALLLSSIYSLLLIAGLWETR